MKSIRMPFINGVTHEIILDEPVVYGAFPMQYTDGNASIPVKYGYAG